MRVLKYICISLILAGTFAVGGLWFAFHNYEVDFAPLANYNPGHPSLVLDDQGKEWARFQLDRRDIIPLSAMPPHLINAFIAAEDWNFFNHSGISYKGIIRSTIINCMKGKIVQGASTITQQLVKLLFFDGSRTFKRKIKEQVFALLVERQFSKQQILEIYLNHVYFGCGIYGVEAASQRFWGKSASQISIDQAATLAGIVRNPARYCPLLYPVLSKKRRNIILSSMNKLAAITPEQYKAACETPMVINPVDTTVFAPHAKESLRLMLEDMFGKEMLYAGGLTIQTTLNRSMQEIAQKSFTEHMEIIKKTIGQEADGALITIDGKTGEIKAMVGGYNFARSKFNRALQAKRQMGSIFKPLVYALAMRNGASFADIEIDEPMDIPQNGSCWQPQNYNDRFDGPMTLAHALSHSNNIVTIKTLFKYGIDPLVSLAQQAGLSGVQYPYPSLALGCTDATVKEAVGMFNIFAQGGMYVQPHMIKWVKDRLGTKVYKEAHEQKRVLSCPVSGKVAKVLEFGISRLRDMFHESLIDCDVISKTGTTNEFKTCWFAGSTPEYTTVVYVGRDDNQSMGGGMYPVKTAFPIWLGLHSKIPGNTRTFTYDPSLTMISINRWTGKLSSENEPAAIEIAV